MPGPTFGSSKIRSPKKTPSAARKPNGSPAELWSVALVGGGLSFVLSIVYQVVIARRLGTAGFGVFVLALAISNLLAEGSDLGLDYGVLRFGGIAHGAGDPGRFRSALKPALRGSLIAGVVAGAALAFGSTLVAHLFDTPGLRPVLIPLAASIPFTATTEIARSALRAMGNATRPVASASVITPVLRLATGAWAVLLVPSAQAAAEAYLVTEVSVLVVTALMLWRFLPPAGDRAPRATGLYRFSLSMSLNRLMLYSNNQTEIVILGFLAPTTTIGIFGAARRLSALISALLASMAILLHPIIADLHHTGRNAELDKIFKASTRWLFTIGLPVCLMEVILAPSILRLFGKDFEHGAVALAILALGQLVNVGTGTFAGLQAMAGYARLTLLNSLLFLVLSVVLDLLLIPSLGLLGAALACSGSIVVVNVLRVWQIRRDLGISPYDRSFLRPIVAAVPAGLLAWLLPLPDLPNVVDLGIRIIALEIVYLGTQLALGIEETDRELGRATIGRLRNRRGSRAP
ncbi:MAG: oligosaccharide flippase family protein [Actinomycetota bacterium]|nr:oligosaccharide flippase family protein [Actinomycetota bacterium]